MKEIIIAFKNGKRTIVRRDSYTREYEDFTVEEAEKLVKDLQAAIEDVKRRGPGLQ